MRPDLSSWRPVAEEHGYRLVQVTRLIQGKSAVDQRIAIDAVALHHEGTVGTICVVTNDTDFVPLLHYLRENGTRTILIGDSRAPQGLRKAATEFIEIAQTIAPGERAGIQVQAVVSVSGPAKPATLETLLPVLEAAYEEAAKNGMAHMGALGVAIKKRIPNFNAKDYGEKRLLDIFQKLGDRFTIFAQQRGEHAPNYYVRRAEE